MIAGCGFLGEAAAFLFAGSGARVLGICGTEESAGRLAGAPFAAVACDVTGPLGAIPEEWKRPELLIHSCSSGRGGADAYRAVYRDGLANLLQFFKPRRVIFTGSTSVYAQEDGSWVNEESATEPGRETGQILLEAETLALEAGGVVARLAGLYGPGRSVLLRKFLEGTAVLEDGGTRWINQIHRDDAATALVALAKAPPGIYNVSDNTPATQQEVYSWIAAHLAKPMPPEGTGDRSRKRGWTSKRVSNARLRATGWAPNYPSYREALPGLAA